MKTVKLIPVVICLTLSNLYSFGQESKSWTPLLDTKLSKWETYLSYRHKNNYDGSQPVDEKGIPVKPVGYNTNEANVFSVNIINGEPVLHITGEIYGCIFTKESFSNYHLILKYKWGEKKWEPRTDKLMDSGVLYNSNGECGVDYWRSWMLGQEFQVMEGHSGDYWSIKNSAIDVKAFLPEGEIMNSVADISQPFLPLGTGTGRMGFCLRSANYESPKGEWTTLELICFGDKSIHIVNGHVVMVLRNSRYVTESGTFPLTSGKIQIQSEAGEVYYKEIKIKKLESLPEKYAGLFRE
ncbi:MAG: DUF1080 domain-containing protein [Bacteroidales bacterium]